MEAMVLFLTVQNTAVPPDPPSLHKFFLEGELDGRKIMDDR